MGAGDLEDEDIGQLAAVRGDLMLSTEVLMNCFRSIACGKECNLVTLMYKGYLNPLWNVEMPSPTRQY